MAKKESRPFLKNETLLALSEIRVKYPEIKTSDIIAFSPVYYPIAIVEMNLDEMTFEDFETVQLTVLKFVSLGIIDSEVISSFMALSPNYIHRILKLLEGYGHMLNGKITEIGIQSIKEEKKIRITQIIQKFQIDALNGKLMKIDRLISEQTLFEKSATNFIIGHLDYLDGLDDEVIKYQLEKDYLKYIHQNSNILNTNLKNINNVKCVDMKYARCYLVRLKRSKGPIVFSKCYDKTKRIIKERFTWKPLSVESRETIEGYGFEQEINIHSQLANSYVNNIACMLEERASKLVIKDELKKILYNIYPFKEDGYFLEGSSPGGVPIVQVTEYSFEKYTSWLLKFLDVLENDNEYIISNEKLYGKVVRIRTSSARIKELAALLKQKIDLNGKEKVILVLKSKFQGYIATKRETLTERMIEVLNSEF